MLEVGILVLGLEKYMWTNSEQVWGIQGADWQCPRKMEGRGKSEPPALEQALGQQAGLASSQESSSVDRQSG